MRRVPLAATAWLALGLNAAIYFAYFNPSPLYGPRYFFELLPGFILLSLLGADVLEGTAGADVILAGGGNDEVEGMGGDDRLCGGAGDDFPVLFRHEKTLRPIRASQPGLPVHRRPGAGRG